MRPSSAARLPLALASSVALSASPAVAGPLSQVTRAVDNKIETHDSRPEPSQPSTPSDSPPDPGPVHQDYYFDHSRDAVCHECPGRATFVATRNGDATSGSLFAGPTRVDLYLGGHAVVGSQGAFVGEVRLSTSWLGISASGTSYFEEVDGKRGSESVRMDMMALALDLRLAALGGTEFWLNGGLGSASSSEFDTILGAVVGARLEQRLLPQLALAGQGRMFALEHDVSAVEGWVGLRAWIVSVGYRALGFNVGPPLHGPEAGVALRF